MKIFPIPAQAVYEHHKLLYHVKDYITFIVHVLPRYDQPPATLARPSVVFIPINLLLATAA